MTKPQQSFEVEEQIPTQNQTSTNLDKENEEIFLKNIAPAASNESLFEVDSIEKVISDNEIPLTLEEEYTPKLFSEELSPEENENSSEEEQKLFDQEKNQEDDFEIPAFLRRQKF